MGQTLPEYATNPLNGHDFQILHLNVINATNNAVTTIPTVLETHNPWQESSASITRELTITPVNMGPTAIQGPFVFNGQTFDMMMINFYVPYNNIEIWKIWNRSPIAHPFHIHDIQFYILDDNGVVPPLNLRGRKDVVLVKPMHTVRFITKFEDFSNDSVPYMYHCHILTHENDGMMGQFIVSSPPATGIIDLSSHSKLDLFPNPCNKEKKIKFDSDIPILEISMINLLGMQIYHQIINAESAEINAPHNKGLYLVKFKTKKEIIIKKLIVN
jgi:bilirubin oxidase